VRLLLLACPLFVSACASDCGSDWYQTGERDGRMGAGSQAERYAARCGSIDSARYAEGYRAGFALRPPPGW
jgi:hypothetical protein